ncbi:DMT family transporter [Pigmentiphaga aceris]|uniref:DMT family transporter n=1 Tax=Pigmentiphaga aceris TaxID=1940612 RepID=A0A5C0B7B5_9BURK|nr:DMT family transporter [Pigmentiphaga aceris]QEI09470.1 DMT family transporter [Pigmentiphaga aceris]
MTGSKATTRAATKTTPATKPLSLGFIALCAMAIFIWGGNWPVMKLGAEIIPPIWFAASRFATACVLSFGMAAMLGKLRVPDRREWPVVIGVGLLQMGLFTALVTAALHFVMPGRASLIAYATAIWVVPGAALILKQRMTTRQWVSTVCGYAGIAIVVLPAVLHADLTALIGFGLLACASLSWAINIIQIKMTRGVSLDLSLLPWQTLVAAVPLLILASVIDGAPRFLANPQTWPIIAYTGPLATALTFLVVLQMTQRLAPVTVSICMLGVPIVGITLSSIFFHESLSLDLVAGLSLMCLGMLVPVLRWRKRKTLPVAVAA